MANKIEFQVIGESWDPEDDNIDVEIYVNSSVRYSATFFTVQNVATLMERYRHTGECAAGAYFCAVDMILVRDLKIETLEKAIHDLVETGEIQWACQQIPR